MGKSVLGERVVVEVQGHVAHVQLNRPDKKNGLDAEMFDGLVAAGKKLAREPSIRVAVISGRGGCFSAGLDFQSFMAGGDALRERLMDVRVGPANLAQRVAWIWQTLNIPVIAAIEGVAFGGGLQIAAGADLRYAAPDARFSVMEIRWGLIPDMAITKTLARLVRPDHLLELTLTGRVVDAAEAARIGLVTRICTDPIAEAMKTAENIANKNPNAVQRAKTLLNQASELDVAAAFALETKLQHQILGSDNQMEAVMAQFQGREPSFADATYE
jgi:enoyl-CoA hydratase/carnithine racemase